jgi:hypothetical protein
MSLIEEGEIIYLRCRLPGRYVTKRYIYNKIPFYIWLWDCICSLTKLIKS